MIRLAFHANYPYGQAIPNAAIAYLKGFLAHEADVSVTNIYWYLTPREISDGFASITRRLEKSGFDFPEVLLSARIARIFHSVSGQDITHCASISPFESALDSLSMSGQTKKISTLLKNHIDTVIEEKKIADWEISAFTVNTYQWLIGSYIWNRLKELNPSTKVVIGGLVSETQAMAFMTNFEHVDYAIWGDGEIPLTTLLQNISETSSLDEVPRLVYRGSNGLRSTSGEPEKHVDAASFCAFGDHDDYFRAVRELGLSVSPTIPIVGSRSCRWRRCKFCIATNQGGPYQERPVRDIVSEIEFQSKRHNVENFCFVDDDIGRRNVEEFGCLLEALVESAKARHRPYKIVGEICPSRLTRENIKTMGEITIVAVQIGFEALSDPLMRQMNKMHRFIDNIQALKFSKDGGLHLPGLNVIRNLPEERELDVTDSIRNLRYLRFYLDFHQLTPSELTLLKYSKFFEDLSSETLEKVWTYDACYEELKGSDILGTEFQKREFFGFNSNHMKHHKLWDVFNRILDFYQEASFSYSWIELPDGTSLVGERTRLAKADKIHFLDKTETDILKACDSIKSTTQPDSAIAAINHSTLQKAGAELARKGFLYIDDEGEHQISILSTRNLRRLSPP
jgi:radical SAM superfamily enzyme YgiQ (UPF0313 family)